MEDFDAIKVMKHEYLTRIQDQGRAEILRIALRAMSLDGVEELQWCQYTDADDVFYIHFPTTGGMGEYTQAFRGVLDELADLMEIVFGEAKRITIDRDGAITVEEMK